MAGTTFELVLLSSSPPQSSAVTIATPPSNQQRVHMTTFSPAAPSPSGSSKQKTSGALRSGSRAVPVPEGAARGFATAESLVKSPHFGEQHDNELAEVHEAQLHQNSLQDIGTADKAPKKPRERPTKAAAAEDGVEPKPRKPRARKPKTSKDEHMHEAASRPPAPTTSSHFANAPAIEPPNEPPLPVTKKPRKPRAKKDKTDNSETQTTISNAKITKPRGASKTTGKKPRKATGAVSSHFVNDKDNGNATHTKGAEKGTGTHTVSNDDTSIWEVPVSPQQKNVAPPKQKQPHQALELEEAVLRRTDWTPTKDTSRHDVFTDSAGKENNRSVLGVESSTFTSMLTSFAFAHQQSQTTMRKQPTSDTPTITKRRRVELVDVPGNQGASRCNVSPEKGKAPKKKPRTITDFVTDQYIPQTESAPKSSVTSEFFEPRASTETTTIKVPLNDTPDAAAKKATRPTRKRAPLKSSASENGEPKSKPKPKKASTKAATKPKLLAEKLLSPVSALLKLNRQDIIFGTSSQLALEESPTSVRQIQQAMRESEQCAENLPGLAFAGAMAPPRWPRLGKLQGTRDLWAASARDEGGQLLERMSDVYIPELDRTKDIPLLMDGSYDKHDTSFADIDDFQLAPITISSDLPIPPEVTTEGKVVLVRDEQVNDTVFDDIDDFEQPPPPSNQKAESSFLDIDDFPTQAQATTYDTLPAMLPSSSSFLDIDDFVTHSAPPPITATSTGSPKKKRGRPHKSQSAIPAQSKSRSTASKPKPKGKEAVIPTPSTPSKPKSSSRFANIEEILDSEDDEALSPSPPRTMPPLDTALPLVSSMPPLNPSPKKATKSSKPSKSIKSKAEDTEDTEVIQVFQVPLSMLEWLGAKQSIFDRITSEIRKLPPTTDPKNPSWHEKILLYDAIILEDFTAFLNTSTPMRAYKRATQKQIKAWNKVPKKDGKQSLEAVDKDEEADGGMINVVEKELEVWMVQAWCQEMSVCCINKVRGGRSGMGKGLY